MKKFILFYILLASVLEVQAQAAKKAMSIVDFLNIPAVSNPQISPDGEELIYVVAKSDWKANKQVGHIWRVGSNGNDDRQITYGKEGENNPMWSPDGKWISFITKRDNDVNQLYIMRRDGGEGMPLTSHKTNVTSPQWSADSKSIYFIANDSFSKEEEKAKELNDDVYKLDENYKHKHLWRVSLEDKVETRVTEGNFSVIGYNLSKNGQQIVLHQSVNPLYDFYKKSEIWVVNIEGKNGIKLTDNKVHEEGAMLSPDGSQVLFLAGANENFDSYYNTKLFLVQSDGQSKAKIPLDDWPYDISNAEWTADGGSILLKVNMGSQVQYWQFQLSNRKLTQLTRGQFTIGNSHYEPSTKQLVFSKISSDNMGDIFIMVKGELRQLTYHYDYLKEEFILPKQELIRWKGEDGVEVEGFISYPNDYQAGTRYPLVVQTHGGPASSDKYGFSRSFTRYNPVLTGKGYVVLQPNYRGSTGYGDDFLRDMVGSYFNQSHLDVMKGVDYLIERGIADPERMIKMGWSAGGHMTNKLITFTDRFKAASSGAGAVNWIGMYAQSDIRTYRTPWFGGSPWQKDAPIEVYWNNSPLKDISNVTTPTLVIVGESDPRVPLPQSVELYRALRSLNVPTHLLVAPREPHGWRELRHRLYKINSELDWFAKYALNKEYEWEKIKEQIN